MRRTKNGWEAKIPGPGKRSRARGAEKIGFCLIVQVSRLSHGIIACLNKANRSKEIGRSKRAALFL
jgi:hypothetical protein